MYKYYRISDDSYPVLRQMQKSCYGSAHGLDEFQYKYDTAIFGLKNTGFVAKDEKGNNAAYYGVFPIIIDYESKSYLAAQSGDTMTVPEHRKKGLFVALAKETYKLAFEEGVKIVFGFPNQNSYPGFRHKLDWVFNGFMQKFTIGISTFPLCELSYKIKLLRKWYDCFVQKRMRRYAVNPSPEVIKDFNFALTKGLVQKDERFFSYKLRNKNVFLVRVNGFTMLVKVSDHLHIGEIGQFDLKGIDSLLDAIKKLLEGLGCKKAIITISQNHWLYNALINKMSSEQSLPIGFYQYDDAFDIDQFQFCHADYDTF